jgi:hypothetical protein
MNKALRPSEDQMESRTGGLFHLLERDHKSPDGEIWSFVTDTSAFTSFYSRQTCEATRVFIASLIVARHLQIKAYEFQSLSDASDMRMD